MFFTCPISNYQEKQSLPRNHPREEVFTCDVIYLFISSVRFQLEDVDGGHLQEETQFLMPGIGTYLFDSVKGGLDIAEDSSVILNSQAFRRM